MTTYPLSSQAKLQTLVQLKNRVTNESVVTIDTSEIKLTAVSQKECIALVVFNGKTSYELFSDYNQDTTVNIINTVLREIELLNVTNAVKLAKSILQSFDDMDSLLTKMFYKELEIKQAVASTLARYC